MCVMQPRRGAARQPVALIPAQVRARSGAWPRGADLVLCLPAPYAALPAPRALQRPGVRAAERAGLCGCAVFRRRDAGRPPRICVRQTRSAAGKPGLSRRRLRGAAGRGPAAFRRPRGRAAAKRRVPGGGRRCCASPNDILGVEYCKALLRQHSALVPLALPRRGAAHDAPLDAAPGRYASASALRALVRAGGAAALAPHVPPACLRLYMQAEAEGDVLDGRAFGIAVLSRLRAMDAAGLRAVRGAAEGLENRLAAAVQGAGTLDELVQAMRTKRYATARLRRLVLDAALGYTGDLPALPPYLHVLGANETGLAVLRCARQAALLPLSHSLADLAARSAPAARVAAAHAAAEDLTALCLRHPAPMGAAYTAKPVFPTSGAK